MKTASTARRISDWGVLIAVHTVAEVRNTDVCSLQKVYRKNALLNAFTSVFIQPESNTIESVIH